MVGQTFPGLSLSKPCLPSSFLSFCIFTDDSTPSYNTPMRYVTSALLVLATSLWLGGLITLALLVMAVFISSGLDRETAGRATSSMFVWFGKGQLVVAAVALIATFLAYLQRRGGVVVTLFVLQTIATLGAVAFNMYIVPKLESLRIAGQ